MQTFAAKNLDIINTTKGALPRVPFALMKTEILGDAYELSISIVSPAAMKKLSIAYKGDATHKNILSFPLSKTTGEIILNLAEIKKEAPNFDHTFQKHLKYIVIHGMLHLAGYTHGSRMERAEKRLLQKFSDS
jgi:probable rRNA maturation factor